ncbi:uncharacterized protein LOC129614289 [Condylostylus longicornis]|uniref:uncharacterized protein LOC129614289 n=1 Tax=Condylostylus longicornis TaxID=2530218 RepID=UPI00244E1ED9|nr:uncharacterized protein LOC129614289 [Condylostylus longicornis]
MENQSCGDTESLIGSPILNRQNVNDTCNLNIISNIQTNGGSNLNNASSSINEKQTLQNQNQGNNNSKMESNNVIKNSSLSSPQIMSPTSGVAVDQQVLKVTIHKDANGYGMKVSGDNPVFVESVKTGGAAQKAGLMANDMILKVNGVEVRTQKHTTVVSLIKSSGQVDLTVKRSLKMHRPTSLGIHQQQSFSISNRDKAITAPQPVDNNTQKSVEFNKIRTLQMMLNQELRSLEELRSSNSATDRTERAKTEANIRKLKEQLRQVGGEESVRQYIPTKIPTMTTPVSSSNFLPTTNLCNTPSPNINPVQQITTPTSHHTNPALLSLFPRSLSSLSLGTKKLKENDPSPLINNQKTQQNQNSKQQKITPTKKKKEESRLAKENAQNLKSRKNETSPPPPLPQRNIPRTQEITINVDGNKRKSKSKTKALSDPKMSTQLFLQVESGTGNEDENDLLIPPPLPPRQIGMMEELKQQDNSNGIQKGGRSSQTSLETLLSYTMNPMHQFSSSNKSSGIQKSPQNNSSKHRRVVSSPDNLQQKNDSHIDRHNKPHTNSWELLEKDNATPPGTPPPPYPSSGNLSQMHAGMEEIDNHIFMDQAARFGSPTRQVFGNQIHAAQQSSEAIQKEIMSMEDEDISDDQDLIVDEHGPFNYLQRLLEPENMAHLAVFLNYVISNSDPEPLLFYLITGNLYKEGTVKDMRKWAYEIHSTFLVPNAPLAWFTADENLVREIDNVLQNEYDKAEILRKIFWKSRKKAKEHICEQLIDFQQKRNAGLGTIYGPSDMELNVARGDKVKEQKVFEETLVRKLQIMVDELEKEAPEEDAKKLALSSALSTVLNRLFITRSNPGSPIGKLNNFVSREKSFKKIMGKNRKQSVRGHSFTLHQYYEVTHCNNCHGIIWGISPQGYHCTDCKQNFHRNCLKKLEEDCPGPVPQMRKEHSEKHNDSKISKLIMGKIRSSHHNTSQNERRSMFDKVSIEETHDTEIANPMAHEITDCRSDLINVSVGSSGFTGNLENSEIGISPLSKADTNVVDVHRSTKRERQLSNSAPHSVIRSESYKERLSHKRDRNNRRKTSDPSLTKTNDALSGILALERFSASSSSSCGSLSSERDSLHNSPSLSLEQMGAHSQHLHQQLHQGIHQHGHPHLPPPSGVNFVGQYIDYDDDDDFDDWSSNVDPEILATLSEYEKKRQEIINELYHSERSHNRILRLLDGVFYRPLLESNVLGYDHLQLLFPPVLMQLKELHGSFEAKLKVRRLEDKNVVKSVGDILAEMFEGQSGENLRDYAAQFCSRQQIALKALKDRRAKDEHLHRFLTKAESHKACRRLQLQDLLPAVLQRLTKYPLLFENLYKIQSKEYPDDVSEAEAIRKSLESSKKILVDVNQAVKIAEDTYKLETIQRKLDKSSFDKETGNEFKNLDLTKLKLVHDGQLAMKKNPGVPLYGLLFENIMVLLQKHDDKYILKYFPNSTATATNDNSKGISPIIYFDHQTYVRQSAVDKNTFFLLVTKTSQMLELRAPSSSECKAWFKQISDIAEKHTTHTQRSKVHYDVTEDTSTSNNHHSPARDTHESTPEWIASHSNNNISTNINNSLNRSESQSISVSNLPSGDVSNNDSVSENKCESQQISTEVTDKIQLEIETDNEVDESAVVIKSHQNIYENDVEITLTPQLRSDQSVERLRQLDKIIEDALAEKQKIVCDMYRIPNEHFAAIADIASQPEAPKDSADIILAAFSQVQSLTSILTEYIKKPDNNIVICNKCHLCPPEYKKSDILKKDDIAKVSNQEEFVEQIDNQNDVSLEQSKNEDLSNNDNNESDSQSISEKSPIPETENTSTKEESTSSITETKDETDKIIEDTILQEDDGYCEIDRLRLPSSGFIEQPPPNLPEPSRKVCAINANRILEETEQDIKNIVDEKTNCEYQSNGAIPKENANKTSNADESAIKNSECNTNKKLFGPLYKIPIPPVEPSIPCSAIYEIVLALNSQISLLLQKINENDQEREKYRKENNKLREILNQMIEHQRIAVEKIALETKRNDDDRSDTEPALTKNESKSEEN